MKQKIKQPIEKPAKNASLIEKTRYRLLQLTLGEGKSSTHKAWLRSNLKGEALQEVWNALTVTEESHLHELLPSMTKNTTVGIPIEG